MAERHPRYRGAFAPFGQYTVKLKFEFKKLVNNLLTYAYFRALMNNTIIIWYDKGL